MQIKCENCKHKKNTDKINYIYCYKNKSTKYKNDYCKSFKGMLLNNDETTMKISLEK